jgi:hypothetical protein
MIVVRLVASAAANNSLTCGHVSRGLGFAQAKSTFPTCSCDWGIKNIRKMCVSGKKKSASYAIRAGACNLLSCCAAGDVGCISCASTYLQQLILHVLKVEEGHVELRKGLKLRWCRQNVQDSMYKDAILVVGPIVVPQQRLAQAMPLAFRAAILEGLVHDIRLYFHYLHCVTVLHCNTLASHISHQRHIAIMSVHTWYKC